MSEGSAYGEGMRLDPQSGPNLGRPGVLERIGHSFLGQSQKMVLRHSIQLRAFAARLETKVNAMTGDQALQRMLQSVGQITAVEFAAAETVGKVGRRPRIDATLLSLRMPHHVRIFLVRRCLALI